MKIPNALDRIVSGFVADCILSQSFLETVRQHVPRLIKVFTFSEYFSIREYFLRLKHIGKLGDDDSYTLCCIYVKVVLGTS